MVYLVRMVMAVASVVRVVKSYPQRNKLKKETNVS